MFSYKAQVDDAMEDDTVSLPHQQSFSSLKTDSDYIYQVHTPSIHMPLYESLTAKPSASKQRTSLYSLTSRKDPKNPGTSRYSSQATLYNATKSKNIIRQRNTQKSTPDLVNNIHNESDDFLSSQNSTPDLSFNNPQLNSDIIKYHTNDNITNMVLSSSTASNFIYSPNDNDSNVNLFSETRKLSIESTSNIISPFDERQTPDIVDKNRSMALKMTKFEFDSTSPTTIVLPPLESSLQNILDHEITSGILMKSSSSSRSVKSLDLELDSETRKINNDFIANGKRKESAGLGDYLQSLKSPKYQNTIDTKREIKTQSQSSLESK